MQRITFARRLLIECHHIQRQKLRFHFHWRISTISRASREVRQLNIHFNGIQCSNSSRNICDLVICKNKGEHANIPDPWGRWIIQYKKILVIHDKHAFNLYRCLEKIVAVLREMPQLIIFFDMYDEMKANVIRPYRVENRQAASATSRSVEIQTETHPIPYNKDPNYTFSIWELRRQAIQLANLRASRTRSTQSDASVFRRNVTSQTYAIYNKGIQLPKISLE